MKRRLLLAAALLAMAGGLCAQQLPPPPAQETPLLDELEKVRKDFSRALSRAGKKPLDPAIAADLVDRAFGLAIDHRDDPESFEAWYFVVDLAKFLPEERQLPVFTEAMDALIEEHLDDDRMAYFVMDSLSWLPETIRPKAREYAAWIERDSRSAGVKFALAWRKARVAADEAIDVEAAARVIAEMQRLDESCGSIKNLGLKWRDMIAESVEQMKVIGVPAADVAGRDLDGIEFSLSDYRGKVVLLDFWGYWCGPCRKMLPHSRELVERLREEPFALIGVNSDANVAELRKVKFVEEKISWRNFADGVADGAISKEWKVMAWPTLYLIDAAGFIRHVWIGGPESPEQLDRAIARLVAETKAAPPKQDR